VCPDLNRARDPSAALDLDFAVVHRAGNPARPADQEPPANRKLALIDASDLSLFNLGSTLSEPACLGDLDCPDPMQGHSGIALDHEPVAVCDLA
jgi:hypothetical protein